MKADALEKSVGQTQGISHQGDSAIVTSWSYVSKEMLVSCAGGFKHEYALGGANGDGPEELPRAAAAHGDEDVKDG